MISYIIRRLLLIIPTLLGIMLLNFVIIQATPGGPIERIIADLQGNAIAATDFISSTQGDNPDQAVVSDNNTNQDLAKLHGLPEEFIAKLEQEFGFNKPWYERFFTMLSRYIVFDFGDSFFRGRPIVDLIIERLPVSISLGLWTTLLTYLISIPLGVAKARRHGSSFDIWSSTSVIIGYAIPGFLFAVLLIVIFAGGRYLQWFPLRGLVSENFDQLLWYQQIIDYLWHLALPVLAMTIGSFATLSMLTKNSFLEEMGKLYVRTAYAKGLTENRVFYGHIFRNAMLIVIAGFPSAFIGILFTGSLLIEIIFSIEGLGLLGFEATIDRDYPIMFASLYFFTLLGLIMHLINDIIYTIIDPRIDFDAAR